MIYQKKQTLHSVHRHTLVILTQSIKDLIFLNGCRLTLQTIKTQQQIQQLKIINLIYQKNKQ
jgi:hypothetical protein